jgi:hypothetical protein
MHGTAAQPSRGSRHRCPSKAAGEFPFPFRGAKQWGPCSRFTNHHACEASQLHRIAGVSTRTWLRPWGAPPPPPPPRSDVWWAWEICKGTQQIAGINVSQRAQIYSSAAAAGRCWLAAACARRWQPLHEQAQGVEEKKTRGLVSIAARQDKPESILWSHPLCSVISIFFWPSFI